MARIDGFAPRGPELGNASGASFTRTLGKVQRGLRVREAQRLSEIPERETRRRELELGVARLRDAARELSEAPPRAESTTTSGAETERSETEPETAARQRSISFASSDEIVADKNSRLELRLSDASDVKIKVGNDGASLSDLADLINTDNENDGAIVASVVPDADGFRLEIVTTETGSDATLTVLQDDFKDPGSGPDFQLVDPAQAAQGTDANTRTLLRRETSEQPVEDEAFAARAEEFTQAFNALRALVGESGGESRASDERATRVRATLDEVASSLEERRSDSGAQLEDVGISLDDEGRLELDAEQLQRAIARDTTAVVELLVASQESLASDVTRALDTAAPEAADPTEGLSSFLQGLASAEANVDERVALLENVVVSLAGSVEPSGPLT